MKLQILGIALLILPSCGVLHITTHEVNTKLHSGAKVISGVRPEVTFLRADESSLGQQLYYLYSPVVVVEDGRTFRLSLNLMWKDVPERDPYLRSTGSENWSSPPVGIEAKINAVVLIETDGSRHDIPLVVKSRTPGGKATTWQRLPHEGIEYGSASNILYPGDGDRWLEVSTSVRTRGGSTKTVRQKWKLKKSTEKEWAAGIKSA